MASPFDIKFTRENLKLIDFALSYTCANIDHAGDFLVDRGNDLSEDEALVQMNLIIKQIKDGVIPNESPI